MATTSEFHTLYEEQYAAVHAFCARRVGSNDAADAAAEVFTVAWRRLDDIPDDAAPWLFGVARNTVLNSWRSQRRRARLTDRVRGIRGPLPLGPDTEVVRSENAEEVVRALATLRPADQEILIMTAWDELSAPTIADILGISVSAAEQRVHRAKKRLAVALDQPSERASRARPVLSEGGDA